MLMWRSLKGCCKLIESRVDYNVRRHFTENLVGLWLLGQLYISKKSNRVEAKVLLMLMPYHGVS
jgi:hypothetical protein